MTPSFNRMRRLRRASDAAIAGVIFKESLIGNSLSCCLGSAGLPLGATEPLGGGGEALGRVSTGQAVSASAVIVTTAGRQALSGQCTPRPPHAAPHPQSWPRRLPALPRAACPR